MGVDIKEGIDDAINSKMQIFHEKTRNGIVLFEKDKFPRFLESDYSPIIFNIINCAFLVKDNLNRFFDIIEPFVEFNQVKNLYEIEDSKIKEFKKALSSGNAIKGIEILEIMPIGAKNDHLDFLNQMGASTNSLKVNNNGNILNLQNFNSEIDKEFDITFSNNLLDDNGSIEDNINSNVYRSMELYSIFSNLTKKGGYSMHSNGIYISSLYEIFFQFLGLKVIDYFRIETGSYKFGIIMKKFNDKRINKEEFNHLYKELKKRNPIRYR